ncbi:hypothetical protein QCA50_017284 [Cerrena zonata]|uniref:Glycoside hydrolase n=1 Tax=Cerrena zonata TaxID=2478898 RepID=A0AAW0FJ61_9APHY
MPKVPSISPATGNPVCPGFLHTIETNFVDNAGRTVLLRGVNLSGSTKAPLDHQSQVLDDFWESAENGGESFVGRPLNLDDGSADIHLSRLKGWGFNFLRYVVTWEALEHAGPGEYDHEFIDYTIRVLRKCKEYGFRILMDPHQDTWSRFSGGSGAPYWTLPACGFNPRNITVTNAAVIHSEYPDPEKPNPAELPAMIWSTNYGRLAVQTVFTLFFAGRDFAPKCIIDGVNIQDYLQSHYIEAMGLLADRIREAGDLLEDCVIGWDSLNEPYEGFCGYENLNVYPTEQTSTLKKGTFPTPIQSFQLGMGRAQDVDTWSFSAFGPKKGKTVTVDPKGKKLWLDPSVEFDGVHPKWGWKRDPGWKLGTCIWAQHGLWDVQSGYVIVPDYFKTSPNDTDREVVFLEDYWRPHWQAFAKRVRQAHPEAILFVAPPVFAPPPPIGETDLKGRCCHSTHYYDGLTLVNRHWYWFNADALGVLRGKYKSSLPAVRIGEKAIRKCLQEQLGELKNDAKILGTYPTLIGEIGIPYDMDDKKSYGWTDDGKYKGDYSNQQKALDASMNACDGPNVLNYTMWTYCPDSSHAWGDGWNMEDLSIWSPDDLRKKEGYRMENSDASTARLLKKADSAATSSLSLSTIQPTPLNPLSQWTNAYDFLTDGARAYKAFCRPYPMVTIGVPTDIQFDITKTEFKLTIRVRPEDKPIPEGLERGGVASDSSSTLDNDDDEELATEIYVPLVHFATDEVVARFVGDSQSDDDLPKSSSESQVSSSDTIHETAAELELPAGPRPWRLSFSHRSTISVPLALDVSTSDGRWAVDGQVLKWWYPAPTTGEAVYTITIKRSGGVIKALDDEVAQSFWSKCCSAICPIM